MIFIVVSTGHFDPLIQECARLSTKYEFVGQIGSSTTVPPFEHFRTAPPTKIEEYMRRAEIVISHGGAGMTAMLNRLRKPNVIIPKQMRYGEANNLQVELAEKWGALGMTVLCLDVRDLESAIEKARTFNFQFADFPRLGDHVRDIIGLDSPSEVLS